VAATQAKTAFGQWLDDAEFSQHEASALTGFSTAMISRAARGERVFSPRAKVKIARRLGASVAELFPVEETESVEVG
jgi:transcriptional regulator with XRE-family HTH domain